MLNPEWENYRPVTRNSLTLADFVSYCEQHPDERFWQALRSWSRARFILAVHTTREPQDVVCIADHDTFYREGK